MGSQPSKSKIYPSPVQGELREEAKEIKNEEDDNQSLRQTEDKSDELQSKIDELLSELGVAEKRASLAELVSSFVMPSGTKYCKETVFVEKQ